MNHLAHETRPYLLQHKNNTVDGYSWGPEALRKAAGEDKLIIRNIGQPAIYLKSQLKKL